jgi:hypothetical protein
MTECKWGIFQISRIELSLGLSAAAVLGGSRNDA